MKNNLALLLFLILSFLNKTTAQDCLPNGIIFSTQEQIDNFPNNYPGCKLILKDVEIKNSIARDITNLDGLNQIIKIKGHLALNSNANLTSISGLKNLNTIEGNFSVFNNASLTSLKGLENLTSLGGSMKVMKNKSLTSFSGLDNLTTINQQLIVNFNPKLKSLNSLGRLTSIKGNFKLMNNNILPNLSGLKNLNTIEGNFSVYNNASLTSLKGLENLTVINGFLQVSQNESLKSLSGIDQVNLIDGDMNISNNIYLTNLNGLKNLTAIGGYLKVWKNASLINLSGLEQLISIGGYMDVYDNPSLINQNGLDNINVVGEKIKKKTQAKKSHEIWITTLNNSRNFRGCLREVGDSMIILSKYPKANTVSINYQNIQTIKFRKKGNVGRNILYGALTGFAIGGGIGLSAGDDDCIDNPGSFDIFCRTAEEKAIGTGILLAIPGALIGGIIGSMKIKIPINGNHKTFRRKKGELQNFRILN